jgi:hypothetical protein
MADAKRADAKRLEETRSLLLSLATEKVSVQCSPLANEYVAIPLYGSITNKDYQQVPTQEPKEVASILPDSGVESFLFCFLKLDLIRCCYQAFCE